MTDTGSREQSLPPIPQIVTHSICFSHCECHTFHLWYQSQPISFFVALSFVIKIFVVRIHLRSYRYVKQNIRGYNFFLLGWLSIVIIFIEHQQLRRDGTNYIFDTFLAILKSISEMMQKKPMTREAYIDKSKKNLQKLVRDQNKGLEGFSEEGRMGSTRNLSPYLDNSALAESF